MSWKDNVVQYGKMLNAQVEISGVQLPFNEDKIVSFNPHYDTALYKSIMRVLDLELDGQYSLKGKTITSSRVGCKAGSSSFEYINFGEYYIKECEYEVDTKSTKCVCYDKMINSMIPYDLENRITFNQLLNKNNYSISQIINGIEYTNNADGTITANGTATSRSLYLVETLSSDVCVQGNKMLICGCPANGSGSTYRIAAFGQSYDNGSGAIVTPTYTTNYSVYIDIQEGVTVENLVFKPQIFNLTLMFGANKEPTIVADFKEYFPNDVYDYNLGSIVFKPMTVMRLLKDICTRLGWTLGTQSFTNSNVAIQFGENDIFDNSYTYRDVLDQISQVAGGNIGFRTDGILYVLYPNNTGEDIDESNLKTLKMGVLYGPINSLVLGRSPQEDNIYQQDAQSISQHGLCEVRFDNNQIMDNNRDDFITALFTRINGTQYYLYELESYGIGYLNVCDMFTIVTQDNTRYPTIMLRDDFQVTQGLCEKSLLEYPEETSETDYDIADTTDRRLNQTILKVDKQSQEITALVSKTEELTEEVQLKVDANSLDVKIQSSLENAEEIKIKGKEFTFNEDGLRIKTLEETENQTETLIDEDGMVISSDEEDVLKVDHLGVNAMNLTSRQFLMVGNCRFEEYDNGTDNERTGCFFFKRSVE